MATLRKASQELFRRTPDETFRSLEALAAFCRRQQESSVEEWIAPRDLDVTFLESGRVPKLRLGGAPGVSSEPFALNDWSFDQLCQLARTPRQLVERLTGETMARVFQETLPKSRKPIQIYTAGQAAGQQSGQSETANTRPEQQWVRSLHGSVYTRLPNADVVEMLQEVATGFRPPQRAGYNAKGIADKSADDGGTGLYAGEQDMFAFLIDPTGWVEINNEAFAPGFFVWNSEVGKRSLGIQTFWYQSICANHLVWDAVEVIDFQCRHSAKVVEAFAEMRNIIRRLVDQRDARRDRFATVIKKAMRESLGNERTDVEEVLARHGIGKVLAQKALDIAQQQGRFTIFSLVDAITRLAQETNFAGERSLIDAKASSLLSLVA